MSLSRRTERRRGLAFLVLGTVLAGAFFAAWRPDLEPSALRAAGDMTAAIDAFAANTDRCPATPDEAGLPGTVAGVIDAVAVGERASGACTLELRLSAPVGGGSLHWERRDDGAWSCEAQGLGGPVPPGCGG